MKRKLFYLVCLLVMSVTSQAQGVVGTQICWRVGYVDPTSLSNTHPRNPNDPPVVYLEDYTLTFEVDHPEYVLYIKDEDEVVVYSTVVTSAMTEVVLPATLSGDYEIDLIMGEWLFSGWIIM